MKIRFGRIITLVVLCLFTCTCLFGCGSNASSDTAQNADTTIDMINLVDDKKNDSIINLENTTGNTNSILKLPNEANALEEYRKEVKKRIELVEAEEDFVTDVERAYLEANGYNVLGYGARVDRYSEVYGELHSYIYPVLYKSSNGTELWSTNARGELHTVAIEGKCNNGFSSDYLGYVHHELAEGEEYAKCDASYVATYEAKTGKFSVWNFEEVISQQMVPENSVYAGFSFWEGYIFRCGTDVYAVRDYGCYSQKTEVCVIAHDVETVISADFAMGSDDWSQPLFLMTDGTVKGYCSWYAEDDAPVDDPSHLKELRYEGGYDK